MTRLFPLVLTLSLAGCSPTPGAVSASQESATEPSAQAPRGPDYADAPPGSRALTSLLSARHRADLPDEATLRQHEDAASALRWIALNHPRMVVRGRALASMRYFDDGQTRGHLLGVLGDVEAHPTLRAAAASGSLSLPMDDALTDALGVARASNDPRVIRAVDRRLAADLVVDDPPGALAD